MATTKIAPATVVQDNTKSKTVTKLVELVVKDSMLVPDKQSTNPGVNSANIK